METPRFLKSNGPVRCPSCGSEKVYLRARPDPIDPLFQTPARRVQRMLGGQLYHCFVCRMQFYDVAHNGSSEILRAGQTQAVLRMPEAKPAPIVEPAPVARDATVIGATVTIIGHVTSADDISIDGRIEGPVVVPAHRLTIGASASIIGNIRTASISVAEGACLRGRVETVQAARAAAT